MFSQDCFSLFFQLHGAAAVSCRFPRRVRWNPRQRSLMPLPLYRAKIFNTDSLDQSWWCIIIANEIKNTSWFLDRGWVSIYQFEYSNTGEKRDEWIVLVEHSRNSEQSCYVGSKWYLWNFQLFKEKVWIHHRAKGRCLRLVGRCALPSMHSITVRRTMAMFGCVKDFVSKKWKAFESWN